MLSLHSSSDGNVPYEDFHERYISFKHDSFRIRSVSYEEPNDTIEEIKECRYVITFKVTHQI